MLNRPTHNRKNFALLGIAIAACLALALPSASTAAGPGGSVVFSKVATTTVRETIKDSEGNPVKDKEGKEQLKETVTKAGGLYAAREGRLNQLTEDISDTDPAFSPDSRAIVFSRDGDLYSVRADGSGLYRITAGPALDSAPIVSPNARYALFERRANKGAPSDLYTVGLHGGTPKALAATPDEDHEASFSADGRLIVFVRSIAETGGGTADDLYSVRSTGSGLRRLSRTGRIDEWSPRYFAGGIVYSRGENDTTPSAFADIYTMRRNGTKARAQVAGAGSAYVEDVSPDGHTLLFRRDQALWVKRIGAGRARSLSELPDNSETNAVFSSDGKQVAAFIEAQGRVQLSSIDVASARTTGLAEAFTPSQPPSGPGTSSVSTIGPVISWQPSLR